MSNVEGIPLEAVLLKSIKLADDVPIVRGYDFNEKFDFDKLMAQYMTTGFQGTHLARSVEIINDMLHWRLENEPILPTDVIQDPEERKGVKCTVFLGYTSNMISSGLREVLRFLTQHRLVDCIVTTCGGIEEDFIKCMSNMYIGDFELDGKDLRSKGLNRTGNLLVPNDNYIKFEEWINPILDSMLDEQLQKGTIWSPSTMIHRFGKEINNPESVYYWAYKNDIPVFCPALTDGSIGDMIYFHSYKREEQLIVDIASDVKRINNIAVFAKGKTGIVILGGGVIKHHICNANLMRNGADFSVYINTAHEFDGSDSGARPDEAISWGKIRANAKTVKVHADATLIFPLIVASTFAKYVAEQKEKEQPAQTQ